MAQEESGDDATPSGSAVDPAVATAPTPLKPLSYAVPVGSASPPPCPPVQGLYAGAEEEGKEGPAAPPRGGFKVYVCLLGCVWMGVGLVVWGALLTWLPIVWTAGGSGGGGGAFGGGGHDLIMSGHPPPRQQQQQSSGSRHRER